MCRASKSRESIQKPCLAGPSGKPIGLRIFMQCRQGNPSGSSRFLTRLGENTRSKEFLLILPRADENVGVQRTSTLCFNFASKCQDRSQHPWSTRRCSYVVSALLPRGRRLCPSAIP